MSVKKKTKKRTAQAAPKPASAPKKSKPTPTKKKPPAKPKKEQSVQQSRPVEVLKRIGLIFLVVFCFCILLTFAVVGYNLVYQRSIFPGVEVGGISLAGQEFLPAQENIQTPLEDISEKGITFAYGSDQFNLKLVRQSFDIDASYDLFTYNANQIIEAAYSVGRGKDVFTNLKEQIVALLFSWHLSPQYYLNEEEVIDSLTERYAQYEIPYQDAELLVLEDLSFGVKEEKLGQAFDYQKAVSSVKKGIERLAVDKINLTLENDQPEITREKASALLGKAGEVRDQAPISVNYGEKRWEISKEEFSTWLAFVKDTDQDTPGTVRIGLNEERIGEFLLKIKEEIDVPVQEGKFAMEEGRVVEFQTSHSGKELDIESTIYYIDTVVAQGGLANARIIVEAIEPEVTTENVNDLGIKELVGEGISNFSGSPTNRRKNIALGAEKLNGILVRHDEEFSLLNALGEFTAEEGWLPELVIKENKTIPEYGGGACQFGTTMFRLALGTGLPITNRANHSYTVSYYNPIGTDATIYDPAPDLRFINDTGNWLLLQTEIDGYDLTFRFYGTNDGRKIEQTDPVLSNWVSAPPQANIETTDLAPGTTKCTERAHSGVTANFTYTVTYPDGEVVEEIFTSKYKPWQAVCLVGVEEISAEEESESDEQGDEESAEQPDNEQKKGNENKKLG